MDKKLFLVMAIALAVVIPITAAVIGIIDRKDKMKHNEGSILMKKSKNSTLYKLYHFLCHFAPTKGYMDKLARRYDLLCPGDVKQIARKSIATLTISVVLSTILAAVVLLIQKPSLQGWILVVILIFVVNNEVVSRQVSGAEIRLLKQMASFISDVRHNYYIHRMVDDSIELSLDNCGKDIKPHAKKLLEIVSSNQLKEDVAKYNTATNNKYLKMFLALCVSVIEDKDQTLNGQILFTANLEHLKKEINIEVLKLEKIKYLFSGIVFVIMSVCIPLGWIRNFAVDIMPNLTSFYDGRAGNLYVFAVYFFAVLIYVMTNKLKEADKVIPSDYRILKKFEKIPVIRRALDNYTQKHYGKMKILSETLKRVGDTRSSRQLLLTRMLTSAGTFLCCILLAFFMHASIRNHALNDAGEAESLASINYSKNVENVDNLMIEYVNRYKDRQLMPDEPEDGKIFKTGIKDIAGNIKDNLNESNAKNKEQLELETDSEAQDDAQKNMPTDTPPLEEGEDVNDKSLYSKEEEKIASELMTADAVSKKELADEMAAVIIKRILQYQKEYFKWYELIVCVIAAIAGFFAPYWMVLYKKKILQLSMEDEVNQFNSIIFMLMYIEHMTVKDILEELEIFAFVFKKSIRECINEYNTGDIAALERLKEKETYEPFRRMVDNFIRCDIIPIDKAFDEISSDRENYHDRRKQENEISVQKRSDIAKPLSFIPAVLVVIYLMGPLMWASLSELAGFSEMMNMM